MYNIIHIKNTDSTNTLIKEEKYKINTVIFADTQNKGRGRNLKTFISNSEDGLYFSIKLKPKIKANKIPMISQVVSYSLRESIIKFLLLNYELNNKTSFDEIKIKWPNDIYIRNKKLAGILCEGVFKRELDFIILGVGINLNNNFFDKSILSIATSLFKEYNVIIDKEKFLNEFLKQFHSDFNIFLKKNDLENIIDYINIHSYLKGKNIQIKDFKGRFERILKNGFIALRSFENDEILEFGTDEVFIIN